MLRKLAFRLTLATALVGAVAISAPVTSGAAGTEHRVNVKNFQFGDGGPTGDLTIEAGDTIVWDVTEGTHTITPRDPSFFPESGELTAPASWGPFTFDTPNEYPYYCKIHEASGMVGIIRVVSPPTTTTTATTTTTTAPPSTTTTTTRPPATTTTTHGPTTSTTAPPATTPTTAARPGTTTTTPPTVAVAGPAPTNPAPSAPGATTTTGKAKPGKGNGPSTTTGKPPKGDGKVDTGQPPPPGDQPAAEGGPVDVPRLDSGQVPTGEFESQNAAPEDQQASTTAEHDKAPKRNGKRIMVGTGVVLALLGLGALGYKWRTRDSAYWAA